MPLLAGRLVGELAAIIPEAIPAFRAAGIDCCHEARLTLREASMRSGVRVERLLAPLRGPASPPLVRPDWLSAPLGDLIRHIKDAIHPSLIGTMETLSSRFASAGRAAPNDGTLAEIRSAFAEVANNLVIHVWRVENEIFPYIALLEEGQGPSAPRLTSDDLPDPMLEGLRRLRTILVHPPHEPARPGVEALLDEARAFDDALHRHIHLEHHVLYPRASALPARPLAEIGSRRVFTEA